MSQHPNNTKSDILSKVPWEPYKAATKTESKNKLTNNATDLSAISANLNANKLIRYNVSTDLKLFNARRPGYQFNDSDIQLIQNIACQTEGSNDSNIFVDARFYPDYQFLKLADELKNKCLESNNTMVRSPNSSSKPINVVGPLIDKSVKVNDSNSGAKLSKSQVNKYEQKIEYLENQMKGLSEHLQIQTQVNSELKKLLVASMGEDIQYKIERLINDKERLNHELNINKEKINSLEEETEQSSIKCDLWRSKFLACRLMSDEASTWKAFLLLLNKQNEKVLKNLLTDNHLLNAKLNQALELTEKLNNVSQDLPKKHFNNFQAANTLLLKLKNKCQINNQPIIFDQNLTGSPFVKTESESIGSQMLEQFDWLKLEMNEINSQNPFKVRTEEDLNTSIDSFDKLETLVDRIKINRNTIHSRLFQTTEMSGDFDLLLNVCNNCKGRIQTV